MAAGPPPWRTWLRNKLRRIYIKLARVWYRLVTLRSSPRKIALGFALGIFLSYTPTFGFQMALAAGLAALLRVNPISALAGVQLTNVFTVVPIYIFCYKVGAWIVGHDVAAHPPPPGPEAWAILQILKKGGEYAFYEFIGAMVIGPISAIVAYFVMYWSVAKYRAARVALEVKKMSQRMAQPEDKREEK